jgi:hypothetical protein
VYYFRTKWLDLGLDCQNRTAEKSKFPEKKNEDYMNIFLSALMFFCPGYVEARHVLNPDSRTYRAKDPLSDVAQSESFSFKTTKDIRIKGREKGFLSMSNNEVTCQFFRSTDRAQITLSKGGFWAGQKIIKTEYESYRMIFKNKGAELELECDGRSTDIPVKDRYDLPHEKKKCEEKGGRLMEKHAQLAVCKFPGATYGAMKNLLAKHGIALEMRNYPKMIKEEYLGQPKRNKDKKGEK